MSIHIGSVIRKVIDDKRTRVGDVAAQVKMHKGSISRLLQRSDMSTAMLRKFCAALDYDFFKHYSDDLKLPSAQEKTSPEKALEECKKDNERAAQEIAYLKEINGLLRK